MRNVGVQSRKPPIRTTPLLLVSVALAFLVGAPVVASSSGAVASDVFDAIGTLGRSAGLGGGTTDAKPPKVYRRTGIDVSHWQGRIDWALVAGSGIRFAIIKATDGSEGVDAWYTRNRDRARRSGIRVTAYHFARPGLMGRGSRETRITRDAQTEALFFTGVADLQRNDLIPALDLEQSGGLRPSELRLWTMTFLRTVKHEIGARPMVYSNAAFWARHMSDTAKVARAGFGVLWVAHWGARQPFVPARGWLGLGWTFWQWTACGRVPGIVHCVDRNQYVSTKSLASMSIRRQQLRSK